MEKKQRIGLIATAILAIYIILDLSLDEVMWNASVKLTESMQEHKFSGETFMFELFTFLAFIPPIFGVVAFLILDCKLNSLLYFGIGCFSVGSNEMLKSIYHQARPYMVEVGINPYYLLINKFSVACNADFGKPSGHS